MSRDSIHPPFAPQGLRFECKKDCSACCGGGPGYVWLEEGDITAISEFLALSREEFLSRYTKEVKDRISLIDIEEDNWNCVMLKNGRCTIYNQRPIQCRTYPFWIQNILSEENWEETAEECPGVGAGRLYTVDEISRIAQEECTIDSIK